MTLPENEECSSDSPPAKKLKREQSPQPSTSFYRADYSLLDFCDDLLLEIFSYVEPTDLLALSECCKRLQQIVLDRTLWMNVDLRSTCLTDSELKKYTTFFLPSTKVIATKGPLIPSSSLRPRDDQDNTPEIELTPSLSGELLESIAQNSPNLVTLIIENHIIHSQSICWNSLPSKLENLSLQRSHVIGLNPMKSFFHGIHWSLPNLKTLNLSECYWFESHSFLSLSKCKQLEELRLADCCLLTELVPYISLGSRFGFKVLTVIDVRRTWITDREVTCLSKMPNLRELYLESPGGDGATLISDLAITAFGASREVWSRRGYFLLLMPEVEEMVVPSPLRVVQLSNYTSVTDTTLRHCASCLHYLEKLDIRGTSCSKTAIIQFKYKRPDVALLSNFNLEVDVEATTSSNMNTTVKG